MTARSFDLIVSNVSGIVHGLIRFAPLPSPEARTDAVVPDAARLMMSWNA
jgi:hypothetical protein